MGATDLDKKMFPLNRKIKSNSKNPIIIIMDVTGSNIDAARVLYDKMPMFYGQIEQKGYLSDFEIAVCAVGDAYSDWYPLQIPEFAKGKEIDKWLEMIVLESRGGSQRHETYELAAYEILHNFEFKAGSEPIIFFFGDEAAYDIVHKDHISRYISTDTEEKEHPSTVVVFKELLSKYPNTFMFLNPYDGDTWYPEIVRKWENLFVGYPEHLIRMNEGNEKAIVDLMLGIISMVGGQTLDAYKLDMAGRDQTKKRISAVSDMLEEVSTALTVVHKASVGNLNNGTTIRRTTNTRL